MLGKQKSYAKQHVHAATWLFYPLLVCKQLVSFTLCLLAACHCGTCICQLGHVSRQALHPAEVILLPFPRHPVPPGIAWSAADSSLRVAQLHLQQANLKDRHQLLYRHRP